MEDKHIHKNKHDHIQTQMYKVFVVVELHYGIQGKRERKKEWYSINNTVKHKICKGRGYKDVYWKWGVGGKGVKSKGRGWTDQSIPTVGIHWETPLNINLNINNERHDCKIGTMYVCGGTGGRGRVNVGD
jgi:hypothetical protein